MQGKERMIDDILQSAQSTAAAMVAEAEAENRQKLDSLRQKTDDAAKADEAEADEAATRVYSGQVKLGELDAGKIILGVKQECVAAVYDSVKTKVLELPDAKYLAFIAGLVKAEAEDGDEVIISKRDAKRITAAWLKKCAPKKKLTLSKEQGDFSGGVILRNADYERDLTVDSVVEELKERTLAETVKKLGL